jgi:hypothetical protein
MNKTNVVQYFLHFEDKILHYSENKKFIFGKYQKLCEENPRKNYYICKVQTTREIVAKSEDVRQSVFTFA